MGFFVLSDRGCSKSPAQACVNEFEDILINLLNAKLIGKNTQNINSNDAKNDTVKEKIVFVICISVYTAYQSLISIKNWRKQFDKVIIYVFDSYPVSKELGWLRKKFSRNIRTLCEVDHIFVALSGGVESFERSFSAPVSFVPLAADVLKFGNDRSNRCISINGYGRQHLIHSQMISEHFNNKENSASYFHTNHTGISQLNDYISHRRQFWKLLSLSKIAMAYDPLVVNRTGSNAFTFSFIGQRWFESLAAGCLVVGKRPICSETIDYLNWDDATVELPKSDREVIPFLEEILNDSDRLEAAHKRNYMNSLLKNDWRHRLVDIFNQLKLDTPQEIQHEIKVMETKAYKIKQDL